MRRVGIALIVGAVFIASAPGASAQVPPRDTLRTRRDSLRADSLRADSLRMRVDTIRPRRDSVSVAVPPPPDSARADSARRREIADSVRAVKLARRAADSIKAPIARAEIAPETDIGAGYRWNRDQLFASGALTLGELLGRIPGITGFSSGWIATPHTNSYLGDFARIRVFFDGVELDPLDVRMGRRTICPEDRPCRAPSAMLDFATVPIWTLEDLSVERAGEEVRVHMRTWRVDRTTPYTRADISTGDLATNSYRGFFGRRFGNGGALQVGAQQYSTEDLRAGGDGDQLDLLVRLGWAKKQWSVDAVGMRTRRSRTEQLSCSGIEGADCSFLFPDRPTNPATIPNIPGLDATRSEAYLRVSYGDAERSHWLQLIASTSRFAETNEKTETTAGSPSDTPFAGDTVDSTATRAQYIATGGVRVAGARVSGTARLRVFDEAWYLSPSGRIAWERGMVTLSGFAEHRVEDSTFLVDVSARVSPFRFLSLAGSVGRSSPTRNGERPTTLAYRGEAGVRLGRTWLSGGVMSIDTSRVPAPLVYDTTFLSVDAGSRTGTFVSVRGPVWESVGLDVTATRWTKNQQYLPDMQVRSEIYFRTNWLSKFPQGNFGIQASVAYEYRTRVWFPRSSDPTASDFSSQYQTLSTLLELRLYDAWLSWQYRNVFGQIYAVVPGFQMPRLINYYGVRWNFFN